MAREGGKSFSQLFTTPATKSPFTGRKSEIPGRFEKPCSSCLPSGENSSRSAASYSWLPFFTSAIFFVWTFQTRSNRRKEAATHLPSPDTTQRHTPSLPLYLNFLR